jgi:hypothetical protein
MQNKGMVEGFPECGLEVKFCEHCIYGKTKSGEVPIWSDKGKWDSRTGS